MSQIEYILVKSPAALELFCCGLIRPRMRHSPSKLLLWKEVRFAWPKVTY